MSVNAARALWLYEIYGVQRWQMAGALRRSRCR